MSAMLDSLCGAERLADIARNDALMGLTAPAVELDEQIFTAAKEQALYGDIQVAQGGA